MTTKKGYYRYPDFSQEPTTRQKLEYIKKKLEEIERRIELLEQGKRPRFRRFKKFKAKAKRAFRSLVDAILHDSRPPKSATKTFEEEDKHKDLIGRLIEHDVEEVF